MRESMLARVLSRGIGKRIIGYFLVAAVLPTLFTGWLAYHEFSRDADREAQARAQAGASELGDDIRSRLQQVDEKAAEIVRIVEQEGAAAISADSYLMHDFEGLWRVRRNTPPVPLPGFRRPVDWQWPETAAGQTEGGSQLRITANNKLLLFRSASDRSQGEVTLAFLLKTEKIWGDKTTLPDNAEFCAFTAVGTALFCTADIDPGIHKDLIAEVGSRGNVVLQQSGGGAKQAAALWQLFADTPDADPVHIVLVQPYDSALPSIAGHWRIFLPAAALVSILVVLLSLRLITRSLVPLQHLTLASRQIASGDLASRVRIRTGDEFEQLGEAFNTMADKLAHQISTLKALSGIDRMILSGTKFEDVSEDVVKHLVGLTHCNAAAVIARDVDAPNKAKMISLCNGVYCSDRIDLPQNLRHNWWHPRQVTLAEVEEAEAPYKVRFEEYQQNFVVLIPVILNEEIKGILLLGFESRFDMSHGSLGRCVDLAGRFAVALSSVEREEALYRKAHFDALTGLPNRQLLKDRLEQHLASARVEQHTGAVLFLDLDRFKEINDMFGHAVGDVLLIQASERIISEVRTRDTVARLGGDEFVIVLPNVRNSSIVQAMAERLLTRLGEAFSVSNNDHYVSASIGIVVFPDDGDSVEMLLKNADAAMYRAKEAGRNRFEFFSERLNAESRRKIGLERDLREALRNQDLEVFYQPQFDISTGKLSGAEALLRWDHATEGTVSPDEFIPLAEESGLIVDVGSWVIERACRDLSELLSMGLHPGPISINVSARQLRDQRFAHTVISPVRRLGIHPGYIQLEVTETAVAQNRDTAIQILRNLRRQGVRVAIDDFGTGYSSLSYLQQMPFDVIKIDKSFVAAIGSDTASDNICRTIIKMAAELGKKSIAEGVEDRQQLEFLRKNGCDFIQGYFYSRALSQEEFESFVAQQDFHTQRRKALEII